MLTNHLKFVLSHELIDFYVFTNIAMYRFDALHFFTQLFLIIQKCKRTTSYRRTIPFMQGFRPFKYVS